MFRSILGIACLLGAAGFVYLGVVGGKSSRARVPGLHITSPDHDFGTVRQRTSLTTEFTLHNGFTTPVEIQGVLKGCSCSEAVVTPEIIPPNGTGTLSVRWDVGHRRGRSFETIAILYSNDQTSTTSLPIHVKAVVLPTIVAEPERVQMGETRRGETIRLTHRDGHPFTIRSASSNHPAVTVVFDASTSTVSASFDPTRKGWEFVPLTIRIATDCEAESEVELPVSIGQP